MTGGKREPRPVEEVSTVGKRPPFPKRKVAILMGYCGSNYQGMQLYRDGRFAGPPHSSTTSPHVWLRNPSAKTIELELFKALCKDGLVSEDNATDPKKVPFYPARWGEATYCVQISWMRACRTDKGVHAAGQVVSLKMLVKTHTPSQADEPTQVHVLSETDALDATVGRLNVLLPADIRVFAIRRAANSFHAKERCDSRFYEYLLPTYALAPANPKPYLHPTPRPFADGPPLPLGGATGATTGRQAKVEATPGLTAGDRPGGDDRDSTKAQEAQGDSDDEAERLEEAEGGAPEWICKLTTEEKELIKGYRVSAEQLSALREFLCGYEGSRMYHNFTIGKTGQDLSARRNILAVTASDPFLRDGIEWVSLTFHGQSFMLHQIRKMVGLAILGLRLGCDAKALLAHCLQSTVRVNIPKAPALGLLLDKGMFGAYNRKFAGAREAIEWEAVEEARRRLKDELIYPRVHQEETQYRRFMGWLRCNDEHASEFSFLAPFISQVSE